MKMSQQPTAVYTFASSSSLHIAAMLLLTVACSGLANAAAGGVTTPSTDKANKRFCTDQGGLIKEYSLWNENAPGYSPPGVQISKPMVVCSFPIQQGRKAYVVALDTLTSVQPTLAVLAYQSRIEPIHPAHSQILFSSLYCGQLGGTYTSTGKPLPFPLPVSSVRGAGWWTTLKDGSWIGVYDFCVFADGSAVETETLHDHAKYNGHANTIKFAFTPSVHG